MPHKLKFWLCPLLIAVIFLIDGQALSEGYSVRNISPMVRQIAHLVLLVVVAALGYWGWATHPLQWVKKFWLVTYALVTTVLIIIGGMQSLFNAFSIDFLDIIGSIRLFFTSPMPYLVLFLLTKLVSNMEAKAN